MAGTCVTSIKVLGAASLGLLSGSLTYQSVSAVSQLIGQLKREASVSSNEVWGRVSHLINVSRVTNLTLGALATGLLHLAFAYSGPKDRHPYIVYSALSIPVGLLVTYYKNYKFEAKLLRKSKQTIPVIPNEELKQQRDVGAKQEHQFKLEKDHDEESQLGKSYIHVSDESSSSNTSTPNSSTPGSPKPAQQQHNGAESTTIGELDHDLTIEQEVENALYKKEFINDLSHIKHGYLLGSSITGFGFLMAVIGLLGETFVL